MVASRSKKNTAEVRSKNSGAKRKATKRVTPSKASKNVRNSTSISTRSVQHGTSSSAKGRRPSTAVTSTRSVQGATKRRTSAASAPPKRISTQQRTKKSSGQKSAGTKHPVKRIGIIAIFIVVATFATLFILSFTSVFSIDAVVAEPSEHVNQDDISRLAAIPQGTNLLNVNTAQIKQALSKNPWVETVYVERVFPHTLKISLQEHSIAAYVLIGSSSTAWILSNQNTWIEPLQLDTSQGQSAASAALAFALEQSCLVIQNVPSTCVPKAGVTCSDTEIAAVFTYQEGFSDDFSQQVVSYDAASVEALTCELKSGVQIALGNPADIETKEQVIQEILEKYPNQITYINVRNPAKPAYRKVQGDTLSPGTGIQ